LITVEFWDTGKERSMTATELLLIVTRELAAAQSLAGALTEVGAAHEVLRPTECFEVVNALDRHLRNASSASAALRCLAIGNKAPKLG
jgi:hypothetical protein